MQSLQTDLISAVRSLRAARWTTIAAVLTLALGTGANVAVLAVAYSALWRPLPFHDSDRLVTISPGRTEDEAPNQTVRSDDLQQWRARLRTVEGVAGWSGGEMTVRGLERPEVVEAAVVTPNFFELLGARATVGRVFHEAGGTGGRRTAESGVLVMSSGMASRTARRGIDPSAATLSVGSASLGVAGVMPAAFAVPDAAEIWIPSDAVETVQLGSNTDFRTYRLVARLSPGVTLEQAQADADRVLWELEAERGRQGELRVAVRPLREVLTGDVRPALVAFVAAAVLLLVVACANVATLMVSRALRRRRELAVRLAIGASPARLVRAMLVESVVIAMLGVAGGLLFAWYAISALLPLVGDALPRMATVSLSLPALAAGGLLTVVTTALAGAAPAFAAARSDFSPAFRATTTTVSPAGRRTRAALVVVQMAMAVVLLVGAGLLARTVVGLLSTDLGVHAGETLTLRLRLTETTRFDAASREPFVDELLRRVRALPGVEAAGVASNLPPTTAQLVFTVRVVNGDSVETRPFDFGSATPGYFEAIGARLVRGRWFEPTDPTGEPVAVLTETAARHLQGLGDPVGRPLAFGVPTPGGERVVPLVVGVIADVRHRGLEAPPNGSIYVRRAELPTGLAYLAVRTRGSAEALAPSVLRVLREIDPSLPLPEVQTLEQRVHQAIIGREMRLALVGAFAVIAVALAVAGLAGALARSVGERRREMAIRAVLGATPGRTVRLVLRDGLVLSALGLAIGLGLAGALGQSAEALLYGVSPFDVTTFAAVTVVMSMLSTLAAWLPARRAARVQPLDLLRAE